LNNQFDILEYIKNLPASPGIYKYLDINNKIIYIGKAKNLKKRVSSYFIKKHHDYPKINIMIKKIKTIEYLVVESEEDALFLENNLIKKYQPLYNIKLKDDKTFPWICISNEPFQRVFLTRDINNKQHEYFGPYTSVFMVKTLLNLINKLYTIRTCSNKLNAINIESNKFKPCLEYHIKNCKAPCIGLESEHDYSKKIIEIKEILKGNISVLIKNLTQLMHKFSAELEFEKAQIVKVKLESLEKYKSKSTIVSTTISNVDVFSIDSNENYSFINCLRVINGAIIQAHTIEIIKNLDETEEELFLYGIINLREKFNSNSTELILNKKINIPLKNITVTIPKIGDKKKLLELSERNVKLFKKEKELEESIKDKKLNSVNRVLEKMKSDLRMKELPVCIECIDNSNIQGTNPVSAVVVFRNAKPSKKDYRHYNIKTVIGANDFATMKEVLLRRYSKILEENLELPNLLVVDGGKGQLSSAMEVLDELNLRGKITVIGIAKKLEEIYFPNDNVPLYIDKKSETLKIIQQIRDEAHRFGITHHRKRREKGMISSELDSIKGIGENTRKILLTTFKSVENIKKAELAELKKAIGESKANILYKFFNENS